MPNNSRIPSSFSDQEEPLSANSITKRQKELRLEREAERNAKRKEVLDKWKKHPVWLVRISYQILQSIWIVAISIGGFIAWLISILFI